MNNKLQLDYTNVEVMAEYIRGNVLLTFQDVSLPVEILIDPHESLLLADQIYEVNEEDSIEKLRDKILSLENQIERLEEENSGLRYRALYNNERYI